MNVLKNSNKTYIVCNKCKGQGKKSKGISKKASSIYQKQLEQFQNCFGVAPLLPKAHHYFCFKCDGSGLIQSDSFLIPDVQNLPTIAIIGAGIGGVALAVACLHRGIPFTLFERDANFEARAQGYGLTLQQASKAIEGFGIFELSDGLISTKHLVHTTDGIIIGEWGTRKWLNSDTKTTAKRSNIHISRQSLRLTLLKQLGKDNIVKWNHQLVDFKYIENDNVEINFRVNNEIKSYKADIVVGADGIRSSVRRLLVGEENSPLRYLGCIVILGICPLSSLENLNSPLLDSATVFQTANGKERIYVMPYSKDSVMWQLSFPMHENEAKILSDKGPKALKEEACKRTQWHHPIPEILVATLETQISGYPVYDRDLLTAEALKKGKQITLIGDAAHPMSPFKGQGANQALLDALLLARTIYQGCNAFFDWRKSGIRESVLTKFEAEMLARSSIKVTDSAKAAKFLHSDLVLQKANKPRGNVYKDIVQN